MLASLSLRTVYSWVHLGPYIRETQTKLTEKTIKGDLGLGFFEAVHSVAMEEITEGVNNITVNASDSHKKNRIQVSNTKKPLFFYVNLAKRYMQQYNEVELSALGMGMTFQLFPSRYAVELITLFVSISVCCVMYQCTGCGHYSEIMETLSINADARTNFSCTTAAIATVVTIAEILKNNGLAVEKKIMTSTVDIKDDSRGRPVQKAKIEIVLGKSEDFDDLMAAAAEERLIAAAEEQS
ncbi:unnamed protein product [Malus baccata var. baccata]